MKYLFILIIFFQACKTGAGVVNDAETAVEQKMFVRAEELLKADIANESDSYKKIEKLQLLATTYDEMNQPEGKVQALQQIVELDQNPQYLFDLALAQKYNEEYEEALKTLEQYQELTRDAFNSNPHIALCKDAIENANNPQIRITNLNEINSSAADYAPRLFREKALVFSSTKNSSIGENSQPWDGQKNPDLFIANYKNNQWNSAQSFDPLINTELAEGVATFTTDFETVYFTRCDYNELGKSFCRIYQAEADGDLWYEPKLVEIFSDTVNIGQPFLSQDGSRLYFSSDAPFGYGGNDIYFMIKNGTVWSQPYNAGFYINTEKDELFPTTDSKGNLYFSSNGKVGYGGLDIFKAIPDKQSFKKAEILPFPINTGADDFSIQFLKEQQAGDESAVLESAVFSSSRKGGQGNDDIYFYEKLFINFYALDLTVVEKQYENPEDSKSKVLGMQPLENAVVLMNGNEKVTAKDGKAIYDLEAEKDYKLFISKKDYFNKSIQISTKGLKSSDSLLITIYEQVELEKIFPETEITIPNIYYDYDKATLRAESLPVLDKLVSFFDENKDLTIEIGSHTDSRGSDKYNESLSQRRAQSVVDYFIEKGVPSSQLSAKGYGESRILNRCKNGVDCTEEEHQENRRTTFRVISADGVLESK